MQSNFQFLVTIIFFTAFINGQRRTTFARKIDGPIPGYEVGGQIMSKTVTDTILNDGYDLQILYSRPVGNVVNCNISAWSDWTECSATCNWGRKARTRTILENAQNGGKACPEKIIKYKRCRVAICPTRRRYCKPCPSQNEDITTLSPEEEEDNEDEENGYSDCEMSEWSPWTGCSASCGMNSVRMRARKIITPPPEDSDKTCGETSETEPCEFVPCYPTDDTYIEDS